MQRGKVGVLVLVVALLPACSLWTLRPIKRDPVTQKVSCVDDYFLPVVDSFLAPTEIGGGIYLINDDRGFGIRPQIGTVWVIVGSITALVAAFGYYRVHACRVAQTAPTPRAVSLRTVAGAGRR